MDEKEAIELLKKYSPNDEVFEKVLSHSKKVQEIALRIAKQIPGVDVEFVKTASLLHDIGRFACPPHTKESIRHGVAGAEILRKEGLEKHALVAERHLGAGIPKEEIIKQKLDLPLKDFVPVSVEEKIICHADNLVFGDREGTMEEVIERYEAELGKEYGEKVKELADEVEAMKE
ncbi:HDIG domain-containing protein [Candidatus Woesearchaeota archaeon]|nr:HDIG domain-containing protein [Candidatus Woesearchaeota archaeon]